MQHFFEGIEARVAQGIREEEVSYQLAFNKQELRKVIKEYPGKEVKKGLDNLYRKVDKHLCEEENLLQVSVDGISECLLLCMSCVQKIHVLVLQFEFLKSTYFFLAEYSSVVIWKNVTSSCS